MKHRGFYLDMEHCLGDWEFVWMDGTGKSVCWGIANSQRKSEAKKEAIAALNRALEMEL